MPTEAWALPETGAIALTNMIKSSVKLPVRVSGAMALSKLAGFSLAARRQRRAFGRAPMHADSKTRGAADWCRPPNP
jgi:hypothetical protein